MSWTYVALALFGAGWLGLLTFRLLEAILTHGWISATLLLLGMAVAVVSIVLMLRTRRHH